MGNNEIRFRFVADVHVGNHKAHGGVTRAGINARCEAVLGVLQAATHDELGVESLVVLGDLFDVSNPTPQVVAETMSALDSVGSGGNGVRLLLGNHDMVSAEPGDHALAPLMYLDAARIIDRPYREMMRYPRPEVLFYLPFRPEPTAEWFADAVDSLTSEHQLAAPAADVPWTPVLCFHAGVRDHNTPKYLWGSPDAIDVDLLFDVMRRCNSKLALCGNWHNHRVWERDDMTVIQVGALVPTGHDNPGEGYGYAVDLLRGQPGGYRIVQLDGPRFLTMTLAELQGRKRELPSHTYLRVRLGPGEDGETVKAWLDARPEVKARVRGLSFVESDEDTTQEEAQAAEAARTGETLEASLRDYVAAMPLEEGVDRSAVEARVLNYLARE